VNCAARLVVGAILLGGLCAPGAHATQVVHLDTRALTLGSSDIVIGRVEAVTPRWNATRTKILTEVTVRVSRSLKGGRERIVLTQLGGTLGDVRTTVPGCPAFAVGEEALLFVWRDARGRAQVNGLAQGKFDIRRDPATDERVVQRSAPGIAVRDARLLGLVRPGEPAPPLPLGDLVREIERTLAEQER
jgi:hypothetical protein